MISTANSASTARAASPYPLEVGPKPRPVLHRAYRHNPRIRVDQADKLIQIDPPLALGRKPQLDIMGCRGSFATGKN